MDWAHTLISILALKRDCMTRWKIYIYVRCLQRRVKLSNQYYLKCISRGINLLSYSDCVAARGIFMRCERWRNCSRYKSARDPIVWQRGQAFGIFDLLLGTCTWNQNWSQAPEIWVLTKSQIDGLTVLYTSALLKKWAKIIYIKNVSFWKIYFSFNSVTNCNFYKNNSHLDFDLINLTHVLKFYRNHSDEHPQSKFWTNVCTKKNYS